MADPHSGRPQDPNNNVQANSVQDAKARDNAVQPDPMLRETGNRQTMIWTVGAIVIAVAIGVLVAMTTDTGGPVTAESPAPATNAAPETTGSGNAADPVMPTGRGGADVPPNATDTQTVR